MLHQDDLWLPGHVEAVRASIAKTPDAVMSVAASRFVDVHGRDLGKWSTPFRRRAAGPVTSSAVA